MFNTPFFSQRPPSTISVNENGTLIIPSAVIGTPPFSYCWTNLSAVPPTLIAGQTNATLVISNVSYAAYNDAQLQLTVTNLYGATNATTLVTVNSGPPVIVTDLPSRVEVPAGQNYTYSISATGTEQFRYQWLVNGLVASNGTSATFSPATGTPGTYSVYVVINNVYNGNTPGMAVSSTSTLVIDTNTVNYWAAPAAAGTGDGSSPANAAHYLNSTVWSGIQSQLQSANVNVNLLDGNYSAGTVNLDDMGDPLYRLTLQAVNRYGPVFSTTGNTIVALLGSQNIKFYGISFTGPV